MEAKWQAEARAHAITSEQLSNTLKQLEQSERKYSEYAEKMTIRYTRLHSKLEDEQKGKDEYFQKANFDIEQADKELKQMEEKADRWKKQASEAIHDANILRIRAEKAEVIEILTKTREKA